MCLTPHQPQCWQIYDAKECAPCLNAGVSRRGGASSHRVYSFHQNTRNELRAYPCLCTTISTGGGKPGQGYCAIVERMR